jgi:hypothetical protein
MVLISMSSDLSKVQKRDIMILGQGFGGIYGDYEVLLLDNSESVSGPQRNSEGIMS